MGALKETAKALWTFWNSFGIPAYPEYAVPDEAELPYITYDIKAPNWRGAASYSATIWYRDTSFTNVTEKADEISAAIGEGLRLPLDGGALFLFKEDSFLQIAPDYTDGSEQMKVAYLSMQIHVIS